MKSKSYNDRNLILVGVPLFGFLLRHIGEGEPFENLIAENQYYLDLLFSMSLMGLTWLINRQLILGLDQRYSWYDKSLQRFFIQTVSGFSLTYITIAILSFTYNEIIIVRPAVFNITNVFSADLPASLIFTTIIHMIYTGMWMMDYHNQSIKNLEEVKITLNQKTGHLFNKNNSLEYRSKLLVNHGNGLVPISIDQIVCIFSVRDLSMVRVKDGKDRKSVV